MSVLGLVDRVRFRNAPPQVREAYRLYRGKRYRGMLVGNAEQRRADADADRR